MNLKTYEQLEKLATALLDAVNNNVQPVYNGETSEPMIPLQYIADEITDLEVYFGILERDNE